jgi:hypothetical protein
VVYLTHDPLGKCGIWVLFPVLGDATGAGADDDGCGSTATGVFGPLLPLRLVGCEGLDDASPLLEPLRLLGAPPPPLLLIPQCN